MHRLINPLFLFLMVWAIAGACYAGGIGAGLFPFPHTLTVVVVLLNIIAFSLGYLTWSLLKTLTSPSLRLVEASPQPLMLARLRWLLIFTLLMGMVNLSLLLYRIAMIAAYHQRSFWTLLTNPYLLRINLVTFISVAFTQTSLLTMLIAVTSGFFAIGYVVLGVFLYLDTTVWRYVYAVGFLAIALISGLITLSRYDMTVSTMYLVLGYGVMSVSGSAERRRRVVQDLLLPGVAVVGIFTVVELLLHKSAEYGIAGDLAGLFFSFYWYLASPVAALDTFLGNFHGDYGLGKNTFFPFVKWLGRLGLVEPPTISIYGEFIYIPYPANVYTYLRHFYEDFGLFGVTLIPYGLGGLMAAIKDRACRHLPFLILYVFFLVILIFSFYSYPLLSSQFYLQIAFAFLFFRIDLRKAEADWAV